MVLSLVDPSLGPGRRLSAVRKECLSAAGRWERRGYCATAQAEGECTMHTHTCMRAYV